MSMRHFSFFKQYPKNESKTDLELLLLLLIFVVACPPTATLQDGGNGGVTSPESRRLERLEGGVGDGGEAQRCTRHPGDIIETA